MPGGHYSSKEFRDSMMLFGRFVMVGVEEVVGLHKTVIVSPPSRGKCTLKSYLGCPLTTSFIIFHLGC